MTKHYIFEHAEIIISLHDLSELRDGTKGKAFN